MNFDLQTTLIVVGAVIGVAIILWLLLRFARRRQSIQTEATPAIGGDKDDPYAVSRERAYMPAATPEPAAETAPEPAPAPASPPPPAPPPAPATREREEEIDISQPVVALPGDFVGIAFPPRATDHPDQLTRLKGVGPKLEALLNQEGITRYEQLASLDDASLAAVEARLGAFKGRLTRDRVVEQARLLASGDTAGFEEKFGKLGS